MTGKISGGGSKPLRYYLDGKEVTKEVFEEAFPDKPIGLTGGHTSSIWPRTSVALECHPRQVEAMNERNRRHGVNVTYNKDGTPVIPDANEWRKLKKLEGVHDNNGYSR